VGLSRPELTSDRLVPLLLDWFAQHARDLPWRRTSDPYAIWVSEVMLQQTQVQTVIPYWERWMDKLPTVAALASAKLERVLKLWEGLGYYRRARYLHQAAKIIMDKHAGQFPHAYAHVLELPGIGRYTAGAICSIAFNQPYPVLDGNVTRVLARVHGMGGNTGSARVLHRFWQVAQRMVERAALSDRIDRPCAHFNQALMELGALVCTPTQPACDKCPLRELCCARLTSRVHRLPRLPARLKTTRRHFVAFVVKAGEKVLLRQRPAEVVNGDLWEFPNLEQAGNSSVDLARACESLIGCRPAKPVLTLCQFHHTITRYRIRLSVYVVELARSPTLSRAGQWFHCDQLDELALPSAHRRIANAFQQFLGPKRQRSGALHDATATK
jgi:A/G-specific adenine glycosylase